MFSYYTENKLHKNLNYCRKTWSSLLNKYKCSFLISNVYLNLIVKLSQLMCKYPFPPGPASLMFRDLSAMPPTLPRFAHKWLAV